MWCLVSVLASAQDAPLDVSTLPWQLQNEAKWAKIHQNATQLARTSGWVGIASGAAVLGGSVMMFIAVDGGVDTLLAPATGTLVIGSIGVIGAPPLMLGSTLRANRALRERGVYTSNTPAITGMTMYGLSIVAVPFFVAAWPLAPAYYGAIIACGFGQIEINRIGRRNAHIELEVVPTGDGFALAGRW